MTPLHLFFHRCSSRTDQSRSTEPRGTRRTASLEEHAFGRAHGPSAATPSGVGNVDRLPIMANGGPEVVAMGRISAGPGHGCGGEGGINPPKTHSPGFDLIPATCGVARVGGGGEVVDHFAVNPLGETATHWRKRPGCG